MIVSRQFKGAYPNLSTWIETNLPLVTTKPQVWSAFIQYSELNAAQATLAVTTGHFPEIHFAVMPRSNGQFRGTRFPNRIYLAESICDRFKNIDSTNPKMHILLESTLLHEMVHWGDWKDGVDQPNEEGKQFERAAYGRDISRYW